MRGQETLPLPKKKAILFNGYCYDCKEGAEVLHVKEQYTCSLCGGKETKLTAS